MILELELENISIWLEANKLTININKTHYMMFYRTRVKHITNFKIYISNNVIDRSNYTKFLGVIIDSKLNWAAKFLNILALSLKYEIYWINMRRVATKQHQCRYHCFIFFVSIDFFGEVMV